MDKILVCAAFGLLSWFSSVPDKPHPPEKPAIEQSIQNGTTKADPKKEAKPDDHSGLRCSVESSQFGWTKKNGKVTRFHSHGPSTSNDCSQDPASDPFDSELYRRPIQVEAL